ncbi:xylose operon transcription regulator XylR [Niabella beijingensis]|uniref:AraC family transcriptional regulator n=1 Tax=Niabella beijingensis TaxID=2872700 RepID=UPI001CBC34F0|nr:DNA-binding transcriptional regulator [Niabella beijingensis]MBZ4188619.1 DNA-binding transcriptional regulator [Niabella beijingensis]
MIRILLLIDHSSKFSRRVLRGLIKYSKDYGPWLFYRLPPYYKTLYGEKGVLKSVREWKADAVIAQADSDDVNYLKGLGIPVIVQNYKERSDYFSNLTGDYRGTGVMAARFFIQRRYRDFAFYGNKNVVWSIERAEGFRSEIEKQGGRYFHFETENLNEEQWGGGYERLNQWLMSLPRPVALFACDDYFALQVSDICKLNNISIPGDIALLGVDNDDLICNLSDPPLSSIVLDVEKGGYEVGRLLHQLVLDKRTMPHNVIVNPVRIELRQSTERYNVANEYIRELVQYIESAYTTALSIEALTRMVPLSRRNLETKFKNEMGVSVYQFILKCRIEHLANLLLTHPELSLLDLAIRSGFSDSRNLSRIFKKFMNCTPTEYLKKFAEKK